MVVCWLVVGGVGLFGCGFVGRGFDGLLIVSSAAFGLACFAGFCGWVAQCI